MPDMWYESGGSQISIGRRQTFCDIISRSLAVAFWVSPVRRSDNAHRVVDGLSGIIRTVLLVPVVVRESLFRLPRNARLQRHATTPPMSYRTKPPNDPGVVA